MGASFIKWDLHLSSILQTRFVYVALSIRRTVTNQCVVYLIVLMLYVFGIYATRILPFSLTFNTGCGFS